MQHILIQQIKKSFCTPYCGEEIRVY